MSKASFEIITSLKKSESFVIRKFDRSGFEAPFHFHPEFELTCILEGSGKRFVGNNMSGFQETDLVLLGSHLPHCWKLNPAERSPASVVIQFHYDFTGGHFWEIPEMAMVHRLLLRSGSGIEFRGKIRREVKAAMVQLTEQRDPFKRLTAFLEILHLLSLTREYTLLNKKDPVGGQSDDNRERMAKVFAYIVENFREEISLGEAARSIGMTPGAFCRYFKKITRKTFLDTVIDYRISFATQQLIETGKSISDICFESGFRDVSHFYKMFSARMEISPRNYRKQFLQETKSAE
jgi:AraC-like DNA-binding protein